ncbi:MAG: HAMP domain-containing histidine kinase [Bacteroidaceae bacterium]|nr:HAMP domain-containing histidine kinase [Bacteroidaceae bacterium]
MYHESLYNMALEAIYNGDFSYRIPKEKAVFPGEQAAIETINKMLEIMQEQRQSIEMASWEKLTRILTHEIMNSLAPIVSLSDTFMEDVNIQHSDLYEGIKAIHDTSEGLISFVDGYRKFSSLQKPKTEVINIKNFLNNIVSLGIIPDSISVEINVEPENMVLTVDPNLIRQVITNIMKNAIEAGATRLLLYAFKYEGAPGRIRISNNGPSISNEEQKEIFVPFFTTKKAGNGIGLSLCRQIMNICGGSISILPTGTNGWNTNFQIEI